MSDEGPAYVCVRCGYALFVAGVCSECGCENREPLVERGSVAARLGRWESGELIAAVVSCSVMLPAMVRAMLDPERVAGLGVNARRPIRLFVMFTAVTLVMTLVCTLRELAYPGQVVRRALLLQPGLTWTPLIAILAILYTGITAVYGAFRGSAVWTHGLRAGVYGLAIISHLQLIWILWNTFGPFRNENHYGILTNVILGSGGDGSINPDAEMVNVVVHGLPPILMIVFLLVLPLRGMVVIRRCVATIQR